MDHHPIATAEGPDEGAHPTLDQAHRDTYITIFLILGVLTIFEVFVPNVYSSQWSGTTKMLLLVILAFAKASLVALFFMHLKYETKWIRWIGMTPLYMGVAVILIMLETLYR